jgi:curved DNA-binding protein CbpA
VTYYEELGVSPAASAEEIREAYKQLARLLHPDTLRDERVRVVAECQMRRLNALYETLAHPERRRAYDQSIHPTALMLPEDASDELVPRSTWQWLLARLKGPDGAWVGAGSIVLLMMIWTLAGTSPPPQPVPRAAAEPSKPTPSPPRTSDPTEAQLQQLRRQMEAISAERTAALSQVHALERKLADVNSQIPQPVDIEPIIPPPVPAAVHAPVPEVPKQWSTPTRHDLVGSWYYAITTPAPSGRGLYPPEYIEAVIREESGYLVGRYRARYRVTDRAISPEVVFQFSGKSQLNAARLPWLGSGGSRGEVSLKLLTENSIEIAWIANQLGDSLGLGSGTAVLVRRQEP